MAVGLMDVFFFILLASLFTKVLSQCAGTPLTVVASEIPGRIESPGYSTGYANNLYCQWLLDSGVTGQAILLYSDHYDLAAGDVINIYDGSSTSDPALETNLSGTGISVDHASSDRYVLVTLTTDGSATKTGFELTYVSAQDTSGSGCSAEYILTASSTPQYLTSAGFPNLYASSSNCRWRIAASNPIYTVSIEIVFSEIENDVHCAYDKLVIYDGSYICENKLALTECPRRTAVGQTPTNFTSTEDNLLVILQSDSSFERRGFVIKYVENVITTTTTTTPALTSAVTSSGSGPTATDTETVQEINIPLMVASAVAGAAAVLGILAVYRIIQYVKGRKKTKKGIMTVQSIAPLPSRPLFVPRQQQTNMLSFV